MRRFQLITLFLSFALPTKAQQADTLAAAAVYAVQSLPVIKASEEISLADAVAPPLQLADVLRRFTGVQVKDYGGVGGLKTVNVRSLGSEHVGVFLDGLPVDNAQNMQVDLSRFSTDGLGTVALYSGAKSQRLQSAREYAAGAAVYLDAAPPEGERRVLRLRGGSFGTLNSSLLWDKPLGKTVTLRSSAAFLHSDGRYPYPCFDTTLVRENSDIRSLRLETTLFIRAGSRGEGRLHLYGYGSERGFPGPVIRRALGFPFSAERQADQDFFVQGSWRQESTARYSWALRFKYANHYTHYNTHPERNPMALPYDLHYRQQIGYLSAAQSFVISNAWSVDLSADLQENGLDSDAGQFVTPRRTSVTAAVASRWVQDHFRAAAHCVYMGAWDRYETPQAGGWTRERRYRDAWMPSISLFWTPAPFLEVDAFAKRSVRLPSFNDLYYALMGNAALEPERAWQLGADLRLSARKGAWSGEMRLSPYANRVSDKIVAIPTASQFRWTMLNLGRVDIAGLDAKAELSFTRAPWQALLLLRYSFQQALDHSSPGSQTWGNQIPYIPRHSGSAHCQVGWKTWMLEWETNFCGERWSRSANTPDYYLTPWSLSDLSLSYRLAFPDKKFQAVCPELSVKLSCNNLLDQPYQVVQGYPLPGRNVMVSLSLTL